MEHAKTPTNIGLRCFGLAFALSVSFCLGSCVERPQKLSESDISLIPFEFKDLRHWASDQHKAALKAFLRSCPVVENRGVAQFGTLQFWRQSCSEARRIIGATSTEARKFFERHYRPHAVMGPDGINGLITGYYEPELRGSRIPDREFPVPLHIRPPDLVSVNLGLFRKGLKGKRINGRVVQGSLIPYHDRSTIEQGVLRGKNLELVWVDSLSDAFFLHIQGSGRIRLRNGETMRIGYSGTNGHLYKAIGRELIRRGIISKQKISMQSIQRWIDKHPKKGIELMRTNKSYIFFRELKGIGPIGSQGVPLTPERSLAIDTRLLPLGLPVWLDTTLPNSKPYRRLMIAQDTGGAIRGAVRADIFWGAGTRAKHIAGRMKSRGRYWVLVPRTGIIEHSTKRSRRKN
ncbi:MAG: MltA domain-containing protein [Pseudomonadota bacterium]|nr:MltA domain-containing protein [Pseudomonadota bacterium]